MRNMAIYFFVAVAVLLGLTGIVVNVLSAIVWLRRQVAAKNSSAIYLAAIAINDLLYILTFLPLILSNCEDLTYSWACVCFFVAHFSSYTLEPMLVLAFSAERLFAIYRPLQVSLCNRLLMPIKHTIKCI